MRGRGRCEAFQVLSSHHSTLTLCSLSTNLSTVESIDFEAKTMSFSIWHVSSADRVAFPRAEVSTHLWRGGWLFLCVLIGALVEVGDDAIVVADLELVLSIIVTEFDSNKSDLDEDIPWFLPASHFSSRSLMYSMCLHISLVFLRLKLKSLHEQVYTSSVGKYFTVYEHDLF